MANVKYNLYYLNKKINKRPLSLEELKNMNKTNKIVKYNEVSKEFDQIPLNKINIIKCTII